MNARQPGASKVTSGARRPNSKWDLPQWERWLLIGTMLGLAFDTLVGVVAQASGVQIPASLIAAAYLIGILVVPLAAFLNFRSLWRVRRERAMWGFRLILLSVVGMLALFEYALVLEFAAGPRMLPILFSAATLPFAIAILALFALGLIVFFIELALMIRRSVRSHA